jgi:hypothetical protein
MNVRAKSLTAKFPRKALEVGKQVGEVSMAGIGAISSGSSGYPPQKTGGSDSTRELLQAMVEIKKMEAAEKSGDASGKKEGGGGLGQLVNATGGNQQGGGNALGAVAGIASMFTPVGWVGAAAGLVGGLLGGGSKQA